MVYIFDPDQGGVGSERSVKKRRVAKKPAKGQKTASSTSTTTFIPLLNGSEKAGCVALRQKLYEESWGKVEDRIQVRNPTTHEENVLKNSICKETEKLMDPRKFYETPTRLRWTKLRRLCRVRRLGSKTSP